MVKIRVEVAQYSGFCPGVERAFSTAMRAAEEYVGRVPVFIYDGPLVHNPDVDGRLKDRGISVAEHLEEIKYGSVVVIRAHGISDFRKDQLAGRCQKVFDATCRGVLNLKERAKRLQEEGYHVVVYGKENHPEIRGITGNLEQGRFTVVASPEEVSRLNGYGKIGLVSQTTLRPELYSQLASLLKEQYGEGNVKVENTICKATRRTKDAARYLAGRVDAMIVIGGADSSNTRELSDVCREAMGDKHNVIQAVNSSDLTVNLLQEKLGSVSFVGVTAGASTPDWVINQVVQTLNDL